jgi:putative DNA primase/helicase
VARFIGRTRPEPQQQHLTLEELAALLTTHQRTPDKDSAPLWSPTLYREGSTRGNDGVLAIGALVFDLDRCPPDRERLGGLSWLAHTTWSHTPDNPKWRVVVPLARPVEQQAWRETWRRGRAALCPDADPACKDPSRAYYLPSAPPDAPTDSVIHDGPLLDPDSLPPLPPEPEADRAAPLGPPRDLRSSDRDRERGRRYLARLVDPLASMAPATGRNAQLNAAAWSAGRLVAGGWLDQREVEDALFAACQANGLVADDGERRCWATLRSGLGAGLRRPHDLDADSPPEHRNGHHPTPPTPNGTTPHVELEPRRFPRTDAGNGELLAHLYGDVLRRDHARERWLVWTAGGHWWQDDATDQVRLLAKQAARRRYQDATRIEDLKDRGAEAAWAIGSESRGRIEAALAQAAAEPPIADDGTGWDADPWLLGVANGVVDLRTGTLRAGRQSDRLTLHTPVAYDPAATCPRWERFLAEVFASDREVIGFVQRAVGYSATGDTREQVVFLLVGGGSNGKSVFLKTVSTVLGPFAHNTPFSTLELQARAAIPSDLADLAGKRFVTASETNEATRLNESRIKALSGEDAITARQLYQRAFEYTPTAKLWLSANHRPRVADDSHGFWRRVRLLPFTQRFGGPDGLPLDKTLSATLATEAPGILCWAVEGALRWQREGLEPPATVLAATEDYRAESDVLGAFLADCCVVLEHASVRAGDLYRTYREWAERQGYRERDMLSQTAFGRRLAERFTKTRDGTGIVYRGLGVAAASTDVGLAPNVGLDPHFQNFPARLSETADFRETGSNPTQAAGAISAGSPNPTQVGPSPAPVCRVCRKALTNPNHMAFGQHDDCQEKRV